MTTIKSYLSAECRSQSPTIIRLNRTYFYFSFVINDLSQQFWFQDWRDGEPNTYPGWAFPLLPPHDLSDVLHWTAASSIFSYRQEPMTDSTCWVLVQNRTVLTHLCVNEADHYLFHLNHFSLYSFNWTLDNSYKHKPHLGTAGQQLEWENPSATALSDNGINTQHWNKRKQE